MWIREGLLRCLFMLHSCPRFKYFDLIIVLVTVLPPVSQGILPGAMLSTLLAPVVGVRFQVPWVIECPLAGPRNWTFLVMVSALWDTLLCEIRLAATLLVFWNSHSQPFQLHKPAAAVAAVGGRGEERENGFMHASVACTNGTSYACALAHHLCNLVPNGPETGTRPRTWGLGTPVLEGAEDQAVLSLYGGQEVSEVKVI